MELDVKTLASNIVDFMRNYTNTKIKDEDLIEAKNNQEKKLINADREYLKKAKETVINAIDSTNSLAIRAQGEKVLNGIIAYEDNQFKSKSLGKLTSAEFKNLTVEQLQEKIKQQIGQVRLNEPKERQEFFKFISGFNSAGYSLRNTMILYAQAKELGCSPVFGTLKEWNKKGTAIKAGEHAMIICMPQKFDVYFEKNGNDSIKLPFTWDKHEKEQRERRVKTGELVKKEALTFFYKNCVFSIDQTSMREEDRIKYLQRYNGHNTSTENEKLLDKEIQLCKALGIEVQYDDNARSAIGFLEYKYDKIHLKQDMPVDSQLSVLTHELGHYLFHRHEQINDMLYKGDRKENPYLLNHHNREIQAQLFSHIVLEGLGIDSENEYSTKYISSYLSVDEKTKQAIELTDVGQEILYAHLNIVFNEAKTFTKMVQQDEIKQEEINNLKSFMPDRYTYDVAANKATVILNSEIEAQEKEKLAKQQAENKTRQNQEKVMHKKKIMQQSM